MLLIFYNELITQARDEFIRNNRDLELPYGLTYELRANRNGPFIKCGKRLKNEAIFKHFLPHNYTIEIYKTIIMSQQESYAIMN